jgi:competence protein ComFC
VSNGSLPQTDANGQLAAPQGLLRRLGGRCWQSWAIFQPWMQQITELVAPRLCRICERRLRFHSNCDPMEQWFCASCAQHLDRLPAPYCRVCAMPYDAASAASFRCSNCADRRFAFDFAVVGWLADGELRELIHEFKYNSDLSLRAPLGHMLSHALEDPRLQGTDWSDWVIVPVPLHRTREVDRGFNQSREIARVLSQRLDRPMIQALRRVRMTGQQARLSLGQRFENQRAAFAPSRRSQRDPTLLTGKSILLVDDVLTTGATTDACARILKRQLGAQKVVVIAVARG